MNSGNRFVDATTFDSDDSFLFRLSRYVVADIGIVTGVNESGRMTVDTGKKMNRITKVYEDVEPLYIGNAGGIIRTEAVGSVCLLFVPQTSVYDFTEEELTIGDSPYSTLGTKGLLVTTLSPHEVEMSIQSDGSFSITGSQYSMVFSKNGVTFADEEQKSTLRLMQDGSINTMLEGGLFSSVFGQDGTETHIRLNTDGIITYYCERLADGSETIKRLAYKVLEAEDWDDLNSFTNWQSIETRAADGTYTWQLFDEDENKLKEIIVGIDGAESRTLYDTDGNVVWQQDISADGSALKLTVGSEDDKNVIDVTDDGITVTDKNKNVIEMTADGMKLTDKNDNVLEMKKDEVDITSKKIVIDADVEMKKKLDVTGKTTLAQLEQSGTAALGG